METFESPHTIATYCRDGRGPRHLFEREMAIDHGDVVRESLAESTQVCC
jgi:hypothetical protein